MEGYLDGVPQSPGQHDRDPEPAGNGWAAFGSGAGGTELPATPNRAAIPGTTTTSHQDDRGRANASDGLLPPPRTGRKPRSPPSRRDHPPSILMDHSFDSLPDGSEYRLKLEKEKREAEQKEWHDKCLELQKLREEAESRYAESEQKRLELAEELSRKKQEIKSQVEEVTHLRDGLQEEQKKWNKAVQELEEANEKIETQAKLITSLYSAQVDVQEGKARLEDAHDEQEAMVESLHEEIDELQKQFEEATSRAAQNEEAQDQLAKMVAAFHEHFPDVSGHTSIDGYIQNLRDVVQINRLRRENSQTSLASNTGEALIVPRRPTPGKRTISLGDELKDLQDTDDEHDTDDDGDEGDHTLKLSDSVAEATPLVPFVISQSEGVAEIIKDKKTGKIHFSTQIPKDWVVMPPKNMNISEPDGPPVDWKTKYQESQSKAQELEMNFQKLEEENRRLKNNLLTVENQKKMVEKARQEVEMNTSKAQKQREAVNATLAEVETQRAAFKSRYTEVEAQYKTLKAGYAELEGKHNELREQHAERLRYIEHAEKWWAHWQRENDKLKQALSVSEAKTRDFESKAPQLENNQPENGQVIEDLRQQIKAQRKQLRQWETQAAQDQKRIRSLQGVLEDLNKRLRRTKYDWTWYIAWLLILFGLVLFGDGITREMRILAANDLNHQYIVSWTTDRAPSIFQTRSMWLGEAFIGDTSLF